MTVHQFKWCLRCQTARKFDQSFCWVCRGVLETRVDLKSSVIDSIGRLQNDSSHSLLQQSNGMDTTSILKRKADTFELFPQHRSSLAQPIRPSQPATSINQSFLYPRDIDADRPRKRVRTHSIDVFSGGRLTKVKTESSSPHDGPKSVEAESNISFPAWPAITNKTSQRSAERAPSKIARAIEIADKDDILPLSGVHGFVISNADSEEYRYVLHHTDASEDCLDADETKGLIYQQPLIIAGDYYGTRQLQLKDTQVTTVRVALSELSVFAFSMRQFLQYVPRRDALQEQVLEHLHNELACEDNTADFLQELEDYFKTLNRTTAIYYHHLQQLSSQCYELVCQVLLDDLQYHGIAICMTTPDSMEAKAIVLGHYMDVCDERVKRGKEPHPPLRSNTLWREFLGHVENATNSYLEYIDDISVKHQSLRARLTNSSFQPLADAIISGGFRPRGPKHERTTGLPEFTYDNIQEGLEVMRHRSKTRPQTTMVTRPQEVDVLTDLMRRRRAGQLEPIVVRLPPTHQNPFTEEGEIDETSTDI